MGQVPTASVGPQTLVDGTVVRSATTRSGLGMAKRDFYEVLGVARDANSADIKKAFRQLALKFHPDRNPDNPAAEESFKECAEAYDVLGDDEKRARYDRFGHAGFEGGPGRAQSAEDICSHFGDIFGDLFGGGRRGGQRRSTRGNDLRYDLEIELAEAVSGLKRELVIPRVVDCGDCSGNGLRPGAQPGTCGHCGGSGQVNRQQGPFLFSMTCPQCQAAACPRPTDASAAPARARSGSSAR
jgi:molecular chaperone DnaJ